jgi:transposase
MAVAPWVVSDALWQLVEPLLPKRERRFRYPGRKRLDDRAALQGILFVLHTGIACRHLPLELGFGSGSTCDRRLDEWQRAGVCGSGCMRCYWRGCGPRARSSGRTRSPTPAMCRRKRGLRDGREPVDRAQKRVEAPLSWSSARGIPLAWTVTGGNRHDITQLIPLVDAMPPVRGRVGRPRLRPERLTADRGYDYPAYRRQLRQRGIRSEVARRQSKHGSGLGRVRWVVERTFAWLHQFSGCSSASTAAPISTSPGSPSGAASSASETRAGLTDGS